MSFIFEKQKTDGLVLISSSLFEDRRGTFVELFRKDVFEHLNFDIKQINSSVSNFRVLRGLHFQKGEYSQAKIITIQKGTILDVAVDLRNNSLTFGKYQKFILSYEFAKALYIPKGFAHGFVTLSDEACLTYFTDNYYNPDSQSGIIWNDNTLNIDWEIDFDPILSGNDLKLPKFNLSNSYFCI